MVLTGLKEEVLRKLEVRGETTIELISFVNVRTATLLNPADSVLLTTDLYEELSNRTEGIVAEVIDVSITPVRVSMDHVDEKEIQRARIRVRFSGYGRVKAVNWIDEVPHIDILIVENPVIL